MNVNFFKSQEFFDLAYENTSKLKEMIAAPEAIIVKNLFDKEDILNLRNKTFELGLSTEPSWHPLYDDCPDYHRLHDNYPKAYVKQKFHGFYKHLWKSENMYLYDFFKDIFELKNFLGGFNREAHHKNIPSQGVVARLNIHHYPKGGGYQSEHIDPAGPFAIIQTLIVGSQFGVDYQEGGVYARLNENDEKFYLDPFTEVGDMIVISPGIRHGVAPIDPTEEYSWQTNDGRWIVLPLFLYSDYEFPENIKPKQVG
jgi:hypothetical protein